MKLAGAGATVMGGMPVEGGVGMGMDTGWWVIMGCWCWGMMGAKAIARAGRLGTGGDGN